MGKLILTSGGYIDGQRGEKCDEIIEKLSKNKDVLIIDNATLTGSNVKGLSILLNNFGKISKRVKQITLNKDNINDIFSFETIYITGGDTTPLIELANTTSLSKLFIKFLKNGGNIIGESAGSMIFGEDLKYVYDIKKGTKPKYDVVLPSYKGLGLVNVNFFPHWNKASENLKEKTLEYEKQSNIKITKVDDGKFLAFDF